MPERNIQPEWLDSRQASELLGLKARALEAMRWRRKGPAYARLGHSTVRYHRETLLAWMRAQQTGGGQ